MAKEGAMSRGLDIEDERNGWRSSRATGPELARPHRAPATAPSRPPDPRQRSATLPDRSFRLPRGPHRETVQRRGRSYRLRGTESHILAAAGLFRVVFERDLRETTYRDDPTGLAQDVRHLMRQGLLERHTVAAGHRGHAVAVLNLTRDGQRLLKCHRSVGVETRREPVPAVASGWRKVAEVVHDASLFRVYQVEAARIEVDGGVVRGVVLGDELKRQCYAATHDAGAPGADHRAALVQSAARLELPVVAGHVEFPDLRLEYETAAGERTRVDLELVTDAYRPGQMAAKQAAGFTLYSAGGSAAHGIASLGGQTGLAPRSAASHDRFLSSLLSL